jgi:hypothetical protein
MASAERTAWIMLITSIPAYLVYLSIVLTNSAGGPLHEAPYVLPALITIGATVVANIVLGIIAAIAFPRDSRMDERDRTIERLGDRVGNSFIMIGALGAMLMAMAEWDWFWIANALFLSFFVAGVVGSIAKISAYRWGLT